MVWCELAQCSFVVDIIWNVKNNQQAAIVAFDLNHTTTGSEAAWSVKFTGWCCKSGTTTALTPAATTTATSNQPHSPWTLIVSYLFISLARRLCEFAYNNNNSNHSNSNYVDESSYVEREGWKFFAILPVSWLVRLVEMLPLLLWLQLLLLLAANSNSDSNATASADSLAGFLFVGSEIKACYSIFLSYPSLCLCVYIECVWQTCYCWLKLC